MWLSCKQSLSQKKKRGVQDSWGWVGVYRKSSFPKSMIFQKSHEVAFVEQAALILALKQQSDLSTPA